MDLFVIEKLIESRRSSIESLKSSIAEAERAAGITTSMAVRKIIETRAKTQKKRLQALDNELRELVAEAARLQPELPVVGAAKSGPVKR